MAKKKPKTISELLSAAPVPPEIPYGVWNRLGDKNISIFGDQVSFGDGDYGSLEEMRHAVSWYVHQFGGKVTWS